VSAGALDALLDAFTRQDLAAAAARFAAGGVYRAAGGTPIVGRAAIAAEFTRFASGTAGWRFDVDSVISDGNRSCVVYRFAVRGGPGEPWRERAGCAVVCLDASGDIAEWREYQG
jgi:limonene-1,2-epoxide hydrolase